MKLNDQPVDFNVFYDEFDTVYHDFNDRSLEALYNFLIGLEDRIGHETELDVRALMHNWRDYSDLHEAAKRVCPWYDGSWSGAQVRADLRMRHKTFVEYDGGVLVNDN